MYIKVKAKPDTRKDSIKKESDNVYQISVKEPAEQNQANEKIRAMLAMEFGVTKRQVRLITGHRSLRKTFDVLLNKT
jgi:uncharacterized protein YggU (UPF0235/DUF167 family)